MPRPSQKASDSQDKKSSKKNKNLNVPNSQIGGVKPILSGVVVIIVLFAAGSFFLSNKPIQTEIKKAPPPPPEKKFFYAELGTQTDNNKNNYTLKNRYLRPNTDLTQGFKSINAGLILESVGDYGKSKIQILKKTEPFQFSDPDNKTLEDLNQVNIEVLKSKNTDGVEAPDDTFNAMGCDRIELSHGTYIFQLTDQETVIIIWDYELSKYIGRTQIPKHIKLGRGLTHDPNAKRVFITDNTDKVYQCNINDNTYEFMCDEGNVVEEKLKSGAVRKIEKMAEMEFKDGLLYINQHLTNLIHVVNPETWEVVKTYDLVALKLDVVRMNKEKYGKYLKGDECMNAITFDSKSNSWYVTGKHWPIIYEIDLV